MLFFAWDQFLFLICHGLLYNLCDINLGGAMCCGDIIPDFSTVELELIS